MRPSSLVIAGLLPIAFSGLLLFFVVLLGKVFVVVANLVHDYRSLSVQPASQ